MKLSFKKGFSFGLTSGVITTLGLMVGLASGTGLKMAVLSGIIVIAVADAMSDALGIHISEEAENKHTQPEIWEATLSTFLAKFIFALSFTIPVFLLALTTAIIVSIVWGFLLISLTSYYIATSGKTKPAPVIFEHLFVTALVVIATYCIGQFINKVF